MSEVALARELSDESSIPHRILELEILYLLNLKPMDGLSLFKQLSSVFSVRINHSTIRNGLDNLESRMRVLKVESSSTDRGEDHIYSLTALGALELEKGIQALSEITLMMQLGLSQPLTKE